MSRLKVIDKMRLFIPIKSYKFTHAASKVKFGN
jgi:hypothetical protein